MDENKIKRINQLTSIARQRELTESEKAERETLRREYIEAYKRSLTDILDNTSILYQDGTKKKLKPKIK